MKELSRKTFFTIFGILSAFLIISLVILNIQNYKREYEGVRRNLMIMDERMGITPEAPKEGETPPMQPALEDFQSMRIMDYEVYTVLLKDSGIEKVISHTNVETDFDSEKAAKAIIAGNKENAVFVGNLYMEDYSYNYWADKEIVILNNESIREKLRSLLLNSFILFLVLDVIIAGLAKVITGWITRPAKEAFCRQREFIADASHELKTPLAVIMASADELKEQKQGGHLVENICFEAERMNRLIAGLLSLSKLEEGVSKETFQEENLSKIAEKSCLVIESLAFEQGVLIETDIEENLKMKCSREEMEKLFSTLLDNAIKHSYKEKSVVTTLKRTKSGMVLEVINEGDPIPAGDEERIFERFYRGDKSRSRATNRYGLGLAIAKRIVINHGGSIRAFSKDGKTTFRVEFK